jgi:Signal transduction histidine kinase
LDTITESLARPLYVYLAQLIFGTILFFVFRYFSKLYHRRFLYTWALSWIWFAVFMATSMLMLLPITPNTLVRIPVNVLSQLACFLQVIMILRGIHEMVSEKALNRRKFRQLLTLFLLIAVATVVFYNESPDDVVQRNLLRFGSRTLTTGLGFLITGIVVWAHPKFTKGFGQRLLAGSCFLYSFYQLYFFIALVLDAIHVQVMKPEFYGIADLLIVALTGMSMVMWLLEDERFKLQKANTELDRFLYSASHDLRAPIASILGLTYLGKLEFQEERARTFMEMIEERIRKLDGVISDILSLSRTRKFDLKMEPLNLKELIDEVVADIKFNKNASAITLEYVPDPSHVFTSDHSQMKLVLRNLLGNAVKYHNLEQSYPFIRVTFTRHDDFVEITVLDNGPGIPEESIPRIFEMFYRASQNTEGTGLGLYIVKEALSRIKGSISVSSTPGKGTQFTVQLEDA